MRIILVDHQRGQARNLPIASGGLAAIFLAALVSVAAVAYGLGRGSVERATAEGLAVAAVAEMRAELAGQRERLAQSREQMHAAELATARRLGQMQAHIMRLNAAGQRLTEVAMLDESEFEFANEPAIGGPEAPSLGTLDGAGDLSLELLESELDLKARQLDILEHMLLINQLFDDRRPAGWPVKTGWISSVFGARTDPFTGRRTAHHGVDFAARAGSDVVAVAAGVVSYSGRRTGYGNLVEINHGNGYVTRYGHNRKNLVKVGDRVSKGASLALVGRTGRSTGPHVHFEVLVDGVAVNPRNFISAAR